MNPPVQEESVDCNFESSANLQFPTIPVYGTPADWLSQSQLIQPNLALAKMSSHTDADSSCDEASSSLSDSAYEFVDDKSTTTDEDEGDRMTESTSSETFETDEPPVLPAAQHCPSPVQTNTDETNFDNSQLNLTTPTCDKRHTNTFWPSEATMEEQSLASDPDEPIEFEEPSVIDINASRFTEVSHTIRIIEEPDQVTGILRKIVDRLPAGKVNVTVRQTMTSQSMDPRSKPYKILFIGTSSMKGPVIQKIGEALAASLRSSTPDCNDAQPNKFNIVPVSGFGDSKHPEVVLIDSSGLEMTVEDCRSGRSNVERRPTISLQMADGVLVKSRWNGSRYKSDATWTLPDLAIICTSEDETNSAKDTRQVARCFMHRHGVPTIIIKKQATWDKHDEKVPVENSLEPHLCLECQPTKGHNSYARKRYPIDLATFLSIDAGQLNRNLACLAAFHRLRQPEAVSPKESVKPNDNVWYSKTVDVCRAISRQASRDDNLSLIALTALGLLFLSMMIGYHNATISYGATAVGSTGASISSMTSSMTPIATTQLSIPSSITLTGTPAPSQMPPSKISSSNTDIASFLMDAYVSAPNKSDKFTIQVLGDRHIVVNSPRWLYKTKKAPALLFRVSRQNQTVDHELSTLGDGVYALQIPHEEATGMLNVSMTILSKAVHQETFEVDFGSSWLDILGWKRAARTISNQMHKEISVAYTALVNVCNQTSVELSTFVQQTKAKLDDQRLVDNAFLTDYLDWGTQKKDDILERTSHLSTSLSHRLQAGQKQVWQRFHVLTEDITQKLYVQTRNQTHALSHRAQHLARLISHSGQGTGVRAQDRLKNAQKKALRAWWKIVGVPQTSRVTRRRSQEEDEEGDPEVHKCFG